MCAYAYGKLKRLKDEVVIGLGYFGGSLNIDGLIVTDKSTLKEFDKMRELLGKYGRDDLIELIFDWVKNAEEG